MTDYNASSLTVLEGLDPVRVRPGMYTDTTRPNHLAQEVIDNSVDEAMGGHADQIDITLNKDQSITVADNGRGMPVDIHAHHNKPGVEIILSVLHSGGKFSSGAYGYSGGLHGVGVSVVNALSEKLTVTICRDQKQYEIMFEDGHLTSPLRVVGETARRGTTVNFKPNPKYFDSPAFSISKLTTLAKTKAVLCPGLKVTLKIHEAEELEFYYENGINDYFCEIISDQEQVGNAEPMRFKVSSENFECDAVISFPEDENLLASLSYVNLIPTPQGGSHVTSIRNGIVAGMREVVNQTESLPKGLDITPDDIWFCNYLISLKVKEPVFAGQTKEKLSNREFVSELSTNIKDEFIHALMANEAVRERLVQVIIERSMKRARDRKKVVRKKAVAGPVLPGKLTDCSTSNFHETELFIVEGDSAGGSAKQARFQKNQAILPIRGKILNTWEIESDDLSNSEEVNNISVAIGAAPGDPDLKGLRYNRICILADADTDGLHIATLLCALFLKHFPALVANGHVYIAQPPLYRIDIGKSSYYAVDENEKEQIIRNHSSARASASIQRFKGLGEMNPLQLRETVMDPNNRRLLQLKVTNKDETAGIMSMLLGKKNAHKRKAWMEEKGNQADKLD